jgi:preprotein translocase subunit SecA
MDYLREGINLRAVAQLDPLVAWQREGYAMFEKLLDSIDDDYLRFVMHAELVETAPEPPSLEEASYISQDDPVAPPSMSALAGEMGAAGAAAEAATATVVKAPNQKLGRNEPCWCGSGKKFKMCHGRA